jgi:hypothetical protein
LREPKFLHLAEVKSCWDEVYGETQNQDRGSTIDNGRLMLGESLRKQLKLYTKI